jgi:hypothetical protein
MIPFVMRGFQRFANLLAMPSASSIGSGSHLIRSAGVSPDEFHDKNSAGRLFHAINRCDVGMIQRPQNTSLAIESRDTFVIEGEGFRKKLDGDVASELRVGCLIDVSHTARTEMTGDFVMRDLCSDHVLGFTPRILAEESDRHEMFSGRMTGF